MSTKASAIIGHGKPRSVSTRALGPRSHRRAVPAQFPPDSAVDAMASIHATAPYLDSNHLVSANPPNPYTNTCRVLAQFSTRYWRRRLDSHRTSGYSGSSGQGPQHVGVGHGLDAGTH